MLEKMLDKSATVVDLLKKYPNGFSVSCSGGISKIVFASSHFQAIVSSQDKVPPSGGYLIVDMMEERVSIQQRRNNK